MFFLPKLCLWTESQDAWALVLVLTRCMDLGIHLICLGLFSSSVKEEGWVRLNVSNAIFQPSIPEDA